MEKHFRNKLKEHKVDWDKHELLDGMEAALSKKKSHFNWKYLFLLSFLIVLGSCWGLYKSDLYENAMEHLAPAKDQQLTTESNSSDQVNNVVDQLTENIELTQQKTNNAKQNNREYKALNSETTTKKTFEKHDSTYGEKANNSRLERLSKDVHMETGIENTPSNSAAHQNDSPKTVKEINSQNAIPALIDKKTATGKTSDFQKSESKSQAVESKTMQVEYKKSTAEFEDLNTPSIEFNFNDTHTFINKKLKEVIDNSDEKANKAYFFFEPTYELGLINRVTHFNTENESLMVVQKVSKQKEIPRFFSTVGLEFGYSLKQGWTIQSGLHYNEINTFLKYDGFFKSDTTEMFFEKAEYFIDKNADTLFFGAMSPVVENQNRKIRHRNKFRYYSMPLNLGYHHQLSKVSFFTSLGFSYSFANVFTGRIAEKTEFGENNIVDDPEFKLKKRLGFQVSFRTSFELFRNTDLIMKVAYRQSPQFERSEIEEHYRIYSLGLGLKYRFE